jgi:hypothetical protein
MSFALRMLVQLPQRKFIGHAAMTGVCGSGSLSLSPLPRCRMRSLLLLLLLLLPLPPPPPLIHENGCGDDAHDRDARGHQEI